FMVQGLAPVAAGNPILVQLDLNLDGMLKVSARERATGLQKQVVIENALARYEREERDEARERLAPPWSPGDEGGGKGEGVGGGGRRRGDAAAGAGAARGPARGGAGAGAFGEGAAPAGAGAAGGPARGRAANGAGARRPDRPQVGPAQGRDERPGGYAVLPGG